MGELESPGMKVKPNRVLGQNYSKVTITTDSGLEVERETFTPTSES